MAGLLAFAGGVGEAASGMANKWIDAEIEDLKQKRREEFQTKTLGQQQAFTAGQQEKLFAQQEKQGHVKFGRDVAMQEAKGRQARELAKLKPTTAKMDPLTKARLEDAQKEIEASDKIIYDPGSTPEQIASAFERKERALLVKNPILGYAPQAPASGSSDAATKELERSIQESKEARFREENAPTGPTGLLRDVPTSQTVDAMVGGKIVSRPAVKPEDDVKLEAKFGHLPREELKRMLMVADKPWYELSRPSSLTPTEIEWIKKKLAQPAEPTPF